MIQQMCRYECQIHQQMSAPVACASSLLIDSFEYWAHPFGTTGKIDSGWVLPCLFNSFCFVASLDTFCGSFPFNYEMPRKG